MSGSISIGSQMPCNSLDAVMCATQEAVRVENQTNQETPTAPEAGAIKIAQATTDAAISSGKTIPQVVMEHSDQSVGAMERMDVLNRDLDVSPGGRCRTRTCDPMRVMHVL